MNEVSIIINGVRYDCQQCKENNVEECKCCDLYNEDGTSVCLVLNRCPLHDGYVFKKSDKKFEP